MRGIIAVVDLNVQDGREYIEYRAEEYAYPVSCDAICNVVVPAIRT